jgi:hypothetical protein
VTFLTPPKGDEDVDQGHAQIYLPPDTANKIAKSLRQRIPLEPTAAVLLRHEEFGPEATAADLTDLFTEVFHLTSGELAALFASAADFTVAFDEHGFDDKLDSLPLDLRPILPGHASSAQALQEYVPIRSDRPNEIIVEERVLRRARRLLAVGPGLVLSGPPGTGKSQLIAQLIEEACRSPEAFGLAEPPSFDRYTPDVDWTSRTLIGGHYPKENGTLAFVEGHLLKALAMNRWLVLDELNRADLDRILGPAFTFLAGQSADVDRTELSSCGRNVTLKWGTKPRSGLELIDSQLIYTAGTDWRFLGTYNNVDLGKVFSMGAALSRRLPTVTVPAASASDFPRIIEAAELNDLPEQIQDRLRRLYALHISSRLAIGPAPFLDMGRYVASAADDEDVDLLLVDAYVAYMGPQLRRLGADDRSQFRSGLIEVLGAELVAELEQDIGG